MKRQPRREELERKASRILTLLGRKRRPFFIEFAGTPKSGKTTTLNAVAMFLKRNGFRVRVYLERASVAPLLDKGTAAFNTWVTCATLTGMIEALEDEKLHVFILDRGLFDGLVWLDWQRRTLRLDRKEAKAFQTFVLTPRWRNLVDLLFVMHCNPADSIEREYRNQITKRRGSIMSEDTLRQLRTNVLDALKRYRSKFSRVEVIDTSKVKPLQAARKVVSVVLDSLEGFLDEEVLCIPKAGFTSRFDWPKGALLKADWRELATLVDGLGQYIRRSKAEGSDDWVQIIPVCVIRNDDKYLTNVRHEPDESLDKTLANWAGGHVRRQDLENGGGKWSSVILGLKREIREELSLADLPSPHPMGLVHTAEDARAARHLGIVFEVRLHDRATAATLAGKKIRERPDKHVMTSWMTINDLLRETGSQKDWSRAINEFLRRRDAGASA